MMKYLTILICLFTSVTIAAQPNSVKVATAAESLRNAMINADRITLSHLTADSLSYGHSSGLVENKNEFIEKIVSGKSDFVTISITDQQIYRSGKTAIIRHILTADTNDNGVPGNVKLKVMQVWINKNNRWVLLARQSVKTI